MSTVTPHLTATEFRLGVMSALGAALPSVVIAGRVDGAIKQRPLCCVWPIRRAAVPGLVDQEDVTLGVRCWQRWIDQKDPDRPVDPTSLEELSETVLVTLSNVQTSMRPLWYLAVPSVTFDVETQGIEVTVVGRQWNPFAMCEEAP